MSELWRNVDGLLLQLLLSPGVHEEVASIPGLEANEEEYIQLPHTFYSRL